jgi:hypothetical protein
MLMLELPVKQKAEIVLLLRMLLIPEKKIKTRYTLGGKVKSGMGKLVLC